MGLYAQPNTWQCGPFALKHGLLALGVVADERALTRASGATPAGADEEDLARAATRWQCDLPVERFRTVDAARGALERWLRRRVPVLLCIEQWRHWITAVATDGADIVVLDSREPEVVGVMRWPVLRAALAYQGRGSVLYDLHPLVPRRGRAAWARFTRERVEVLRRPEHRELRLAWSAYLAPLLSVSRPLETQPELTLPLDDLLRRFEPDLLAQARDGGGGTAAERATRRRLMHVGFVAATYGLSVAPDGEAAARGTLAALAGVSLPAAWIPRTAGRGHRAVRHARPPAG